MPPEVNKRALTDFCALVLYTRRKLPDLGLKWENKMCAALWSAFLQGRRATEQGRMIHGQGSVATGRCSRFCVMLSKFASSLVPEKEQRASLHTF